MHTMYEPYALEPRLIMQLTVSKILQRLPGDPPLNAPSLPAADAIPNEVAKQAAVRHGVVPGIVAPVKVRIFTIHPLYSVVTVPL